MNKYRFVLASIILVATFLSSCDSDLETCTTVPEQVPEIEWVKFDHLAVGASEEELEVLLKTHSSYSKLFLLSNKFPNYAALAKSVHHLTNNPSLDTLRMETNNAFGDQKAVKQEFEEAFARLSQYYPETKTPKVYTTLTGFGKEMYLSDSLIIMSLDYYAGKEATFRPLGIPDYIMRRYEPEYLTNLVMTYISENYNKVNPKDNSMLGEMISYGKTYYFNQQMLPCKSDTIITGFSVSEMAKVKANQEVIWAHFINNELLYETNHFVINKYIQERPSVYEIGDECPGRIGRWVGLEIVKAYMDKNPEVTLQELMAETDAQKIFSKSKYKPKKN